MDSNRQVDKTWLLSVQRKLYQWSRENPEDAYHDLWNWLTDLRNLRCAWRHVASRRGKRTPGVDGMTVAKIRRVMGEETFLEELRQELRSGSYKPSPSRRKMIPKPGKPKELRPLAIPTVKDRVVQCAVKQILEPIFEAQFWHVSYGFRPGRNCHGALEHIRLATTPRAKRQAGGKRVAFPYKWVIEGDIKGCFDNISHHAIAMRLRKRVSDRKVLRLVLQFLKAGVLAEEQFIRTPAGTPQGGIISPLVANIALSAIEERYERWVHRKPAQRRGAQTDGRKAAYNARTNDRAAGKMVCFPIRYADDFVILVYGNREQAETEKNALAEHLRRNLGLELSAEKTRITPIKEGFGFLGHRVRLKEDRKGGYYTSLEIPKAKTADLRFRIKGLTGRSTLGSRLPKLLIRLNQILRGWAYFYHHCYGAHRVFNHIDWYTAGRLWRWLRKKNPRKGAKHILRRFYKCSQVRRRRVCGKDGVEQFLTDAVSVKRYRLGWVRLPDYAMTSGEPDA